MTDTPREVQTPTIEEMIKQLEAAGWKRWKRKMTVWESPKGQLFRGPAKAYELMQKDWEHFL